MNQDSRQKQSQDMAGFLMQPSPFHLWINFDTRISCIFLELVEMYVLHAHI
jgi:hypothetical protein